MTLVSCQKPEARDPKQYRPNVGIALFSKAGQIMVGRRIDTPGRNIWQMPQGGIDADESPKQAIFRELEEETGLAPEHVRILGQIDEWLYYDFPPEIKARLKSPFSGQRQKWFALRLSAPEHHINLHTHQPEFEAWRWIDLDEAPARVVPFKRDVYQHVANAFACWAKP